jgi:predicted AAA+ superfamily ATPase
MEGISGVGHWRTHDGSEVDLVIERDDGAIVGIEVKAGSRVQDRDLAGLRILKGELGDAFIAGAVLYTGSRAYTVEDRIHVAPADRVWIPA